MIALLGLNRKSPTRVHIQHIDEHYEEWNPSGHIIVFAVREGQFCIERHQGIDSRAGFTSDPRMRLEK